MYKRQHQLHFRVLLPDGLLIKHRFVRSADGLSLSQRTALTAPGVARDMEVVKIFSRYDRGERGYLQMSPYAASVCCAPSNPKPTPNKASIKHPTRPNAEALGQRIIAGST